MSSDPRSDLVVLVARQGTATALVDSLRDWSTAGLLRDFYVVDVDRQRADDTTVAALAVAGGHVRSVALQDELARRPRTDRARVVAVSELSSPDRLLAPSTALRVAAAVTDALPSVEPSRLHIIGVASPQGPTTGDFGWIGWHNVVVAPENSQSPTAGVAPIGPSSSHALRTNHLAAALGSLAAIWHVVPDGPFDDRAAPPGANLTVARTFTRHLSAAAVGSELLGRLAGVGDGYPVPLVEGSSAWVIEDEVAAATEMGDLLLDKHRDVLPRERRMPGARPQRKIGAWEALKMLFAFLGGALKNAPKAFLDSMVRRASVATAAAVNAAAFGRDSEFTVVVNGYRPDGTPASWEEMEAAVESASARLLGRSTESHEPRPDNATLWKDFVAGGLTLLDAAARVTELPPRMTGGRRGVVTSPARVAPDPTDTFRPPETVAAWIVDREVAAFDPVAADVLKRQLDELAQSQPHVSGAARTVGSELQAWFEARRRSYVGRIGHVLAGHLWSVRDEIGHLVDRLLRAESASEVPSRIEDQQRSLASRLWGILAVAVLALVGVGALVYLEVLGVLIGVGVAVLVVIAWVVSSTYAFLKGQAELFRLLHERERLQEELEVLRSHLIEALADLRRLQVTYRQYLDWCHALGSFVQHPLGSPDAATDDEILPGAGVTLNHRFGAARPNPAVLDDEAARLRRDLFNVGWLSDAWASFLDDVPSSLGPMAFRVQESSDLLFADAGVARQSILHEWAQVVTGRSSWVGATTGLRARLAGLLDGGNAELIRRLLVSVESRDTRGDIDVVSYEAFVNGLDHPEAWRDDYHAFTRSMFSEHAASGEPWRVHRTIAHSDSADLGRTLVVTQLSQGLSPHDLAFATAPRAEATEIVPDAPERPRL